MWLITKENSHFDNVIDTYMTSGNYDEYGYGLNLDMLIISSLLLVSCPRRSRLI